MSIEFGDLLDIIVNNSNELQCNECIDAFQKLKKFKQKFLMTPSRIKQSAFPDGVNVSVYRIHKHKTQLLNDMVGINTNLEFSWKNYKGIFKSYLSSIVLLILGFNLSLRT